MVEAVEVTVPEGLKRLFEGIQPFGEDFYHDARLVSKQYGRFLMKERRATKQRLQHAYTSWARELLKTYLLGVKKLEDTLLKLAEERMGMHPTWRWCMECVAGARERVAIFLVGQVNPYVCTSCGKVWKWWWLIPGARLRRGEKAEGQPWLAGIASFIADLMVMRGNPYYRPIYDAKKHYYLYTRGFIRYVEDPTLCPNYGECKKRCVEKAKRRGLPPSKAKEPACRAHVDRMAKRFMVKVLLCHALQLNRATEGMTLSRHRNYIHIPVSADDTPDPEVLERLKTGRIQ